MPPLIRILALALALAAGVASAAEPTLARKITAIEAAETAELARLNEALAGTTDHAEILALQQTAGYVKLASRLALHEAQLAVTSDEAVQAELTDLVEDLRTRVEARKTLLPDDYAFEPLAALAQEVPPCVE
jgi:hypothetical protein